MTNQQLCEHLFTQDPDKEVTIRIESFFDGVKILRVIDIEGTELQTEIKEKL